MDEYFIKQLKQEELYSDKSDYENIKITTPSDIEIVTYYLSKKGRE